MEKVRRAAADGVGAPLGKSPAAGPAEYVLLMRLRGFAVSVVLTSAVMALGLTPVASSAAETPYLNEIAAHLRARAPGTENRIWWISHGNHVPAHWLLNTPDCWGAHECRTPPPGGVRYVHAVARMVADARSSVDISDLYPPPDGPFRNGIVEGLREAIRRGHHLTVRVLVGTYPSSFAVSFFTGGIVQAETYANDLLSALGGSNPKPTIDVAYTETVRFGIGALSFATSWNHEKVVDVDGESAIVGGMNPWTKDYLSAPNPVDDVSMQVKGPAAADVMRYDNVLWGWACSHASESTLVTRNGGCLATAHPATPAVTGGVPIMVVGHLGNGISVPGAPHGESPPIGGVPVSGNRCSVLRSPSESNDDRKYEFRNPGEDALRALVGSARHSIFISQQDLLSCLPLGVAATESKFDDRLFAILGRKIAAHVPIRIVVSPKANADYSNGYTLTDVAEVLKAVVSKEEHVSAAKARERLCQDVGLTTIQDRPGNWPGDRAFRNHAKLVAVDDRAFYIGSENLYPARLQELGLIVEDHTAANHLKTAYLDPLWRYSGPHGLIDPPYRCHSF